MTFKSPAYQDSPTPISSDAREHTYKVDTPMSSHNSLSLPYLFSDSLSLYLSLSFSNVREGAISDDVIAGPEVM